MDANPALHILLTSLIIDDLAASVNKCDRVHGDKTYIRILFPEPATEKEMIQDCREADIRNLRFP